MKFFLMTVFLLISIVFLCSIFFCFQGSFKYSSKTYPKEKIAKQNILTLFRWIGEGDLEKAEVKNVISAIKKQLTVLRRETASGRCSCAAVYERLDSNLLNALIKGYEYGNNNGLLLNRLFVESAAGKVNTASPRHPWFDIQNNLIDCLANEVIISCDRSTETAKTDLLKPEIFIAPTITSIVDLVENNFNSILKTQLSLSGAYRLILKGSTGRGTSLDNADFDFDLLFDKQEDLSLFLRKLNPIIDHLTKKWRSQGCNVLSKIERDVSKRRLINFIVQDKDGVVLRIQLFVGGKTRIYADILNQQIGQIKALGGNWDDLKGQIILFKKLVRDVFHSYGKFYGGIDGMRCEQLIVQAGSSSDYGDKIIGVGSFDKTMRWIYNIGFDQASSVIIPFDRVVNQMLVYKYTTDNPMLISSPVLWDKLVNAARKYVALAKTEMSEDEFASLGR